MNENMTLLLVFSVIIYGLFSVHIWYTKETVEEKKSDEIEVAKKVLKNEEPEKQIPVKGNKIITKTIPLIIVNGCSIIEVFTQKQDMTRIVKRKLTENDGNAIAVIGITFFLVILALSAILDVIKVKEEERARREINPEGERRQSLSEFANKKMFRRESSKLGNQLIQISEMFNSHDDKKSNRKQNRQYTRADSTNSYLSERRSTKECSAPASIGESSKGQPKLVKRQSVAKLFGLTDD